MAWRDNLLDGTLGGVPIPVSVTEEDIQRSVPVFRLPYVDGGEPWDLGANEMLLSFDLIFFGDDYDTRLAALLAEFYKHGIRELVHPVWGAMPVQPTALKMRHSAPEPDCCTVTITLLQQAITTRVFTAATPRQSADAVSNVGAGAQDFSISGFLRDLANRIKEFTALPVLVAAGVEMSAIISAIRDLSPRSLLPVLPILESPQGYVTGLREALESLLDFPDYDIFNMADWKRVMDTSNDVVKHARRDSPIPRDPRVAPLRAVVDDLIVRETSIQVATTAGIMLGLEADEPTMHPHEIETIAADTRTLLNEAIASARETLPVEEHHEIAESLKQLAWYVQDTARQVLGARPPLVERAAPGECNLRLLAHWWYEDHTRAAELLRLNPHLREPNFIHTGQVLNAYAR